MASLQEQLLKAGMVDEKRAKKIKKEQRRAAKKIPKGQTQTSEAQVLAKQVQTEKSSRDREINHRRQEAANEKAIAAQVKQLITVNRIDRSAGEIAFQFTDGKKIKKLYVTSSLQNQLSKGLIAVVKTGGHYELVPAIVADKIKQRSDTTVLFHLAQGKDAKLSETDENDPYADYQIPDDLMW